MLGFRNMQEKLKRLFAIIYRLFEIIAPIGRLTVESII